MNEAHFSAADGFGRPLTPREIQVLALVGTGKSNQEVARTMAVGHDTVKFHLRNIFRKLGARRRTEAVFKASQSGLLREYHQA